MTNLEYYYWFILDKKELRAAFRNKVINETSIGVTSFYRLLRIEPHKLVKIKVSEISNIEIDQLYKDHSKLTLTPIK